MVDNAACQQTSNSLVANWERSMSQAASVATENLPSELHELVAAIERLPPAQAHSMAAVALKVVEGAQRRRKILDLVQDALSQLRLDMKYLIFDLESTRRERDAYKRQIDELGELGE